jgi:hypothetical protein
MRTLRLSLVGAAILVFLGGVGAATTSAQDEPGSAATATPRPVGEVCEPIDLPYDPEDIRLSGVWSGSNGTVAYVSQDGSRIYLLHQPGRDEPPERLGRFWTTVATGTLADDGTMTLDYGQVPRGEWWVDDFGTMTGRVAGEPGEAISFSLHYPATPARPELTYTLTPCAPATKTTTGFRPAFTFRDEPRVQLSLFEGLGLVWLPASDHAGVESGITVWSIAPASARTCEGGPSQPIEPGAEAFLAWLASREDLIVGEPVDVTVDGRPATMVDLTPAPGATGCLEDGTKLRLWSVFGTDSAVFIDSMARVILMDVGDSTLAIDMSGDDQDTWLPRAQKVVGTIHFTE